MDATVHLHLPGPPQGTTYTVTHADGSVTTITGSAAADKDGATSAPSSSASLPPEVEQMIGRHEKNGLKGTRSRDLVHALSDRGWTVKAGPKYLRFIYQGTTKSNINTKVTLYANSKDLLCRDDNDLYAKTLPGAKMTASGIRFDYVAEFDNAVAAAAAMEDWANGLAPT